MKSILAIASFIFLAQGVFAHNGGHGEVRENPLSHHLVFSKSQIHAHTAWAEKPRVGVENILKIEWRSAQDHSLVEPANFEVSLWMPSMGHGSAPTQKNPTVDGFGNILPGLYEISNIYFTMGGDWQVILTVTNVDGSQESQVLDLLFPMSGHHH